MTSSANIIIINGPNLNMLGMREPEIYGSVTLGDIEEQCHSVAHDLNLHIDFFQSNLEGDLINWVQQAPETYDGVIINPAGYGATSIALLDALLMTKLPVIEVHVSNIYRRESFRHHSYVSLASQGIICGLGAQGYSLALRAMAEIIGVIKVEE
ncbi:MAG: type II 3-dehydroquinate dehydratase [Alphaproteobacteria bacterium]|nr:type II 3-dehydroquinate dehydratase [Alphaproteobacteria bacterium]